MNLSQCHNHQKSSLFFPSGTLVEKCITSCHFKSLKLIIQSSPFFCFFGFDSSLPWGFSGGSDSQDSACNTGDPGSILGSGRFLGEGNGNPLHSRHTGPKLPIQKLNLCPWQWKHNLNHCTTRKILKGPVARFFLTSYSVCFFSAVAKTLNTLLICDILSILPISIVWL